MLTGEAKKNYQREYMREYMRKRRGLNNKVLTVDVGLNKVIETKGLNKDKGLNEEVLTKEVFIGGRRFEVPC